MAVKLGTTDIVFRSGSGTPAKVFKGSTPVQTLPGAPTLLSSEDSGGGVTSVDLFPPEDRGGSPLTALKFYMDGVLQSTRPLLSGSIPTTFLLAGSFAGQEAKVSAVNAIGEGPLSSGATVT
jgi:hypothetical protein